MRYTQFDRRLGQDKNINASTRLHYATVGRPYGRHLPEKGKTGIWGVCVTSLASEQVCM